MYKLISYDHEYSELTNNNQKKLKSMIGLWFLRLTKEKDILNF